MKEKSNVLQFGLDLRATHRQSEGGSTPPDDAASVKRRAEAPTLQDLAAISLAARDDRTVDDHAATTFEPPPDVAELSAIIAASLPCSRAPLPPTVPSGPTLSLSALPPSAKRLERATDKLELDPQRRRIALAIIGFGILLLGAEAVSLVREMREDAAQPAAPPASPKPALKSRSIELPAASEIVVHEPSPETAPATARPSQVVKKRPPKTPIHHQKKRARSRKRH